MQMLIARLLEFGGEGLMISAIAGTNDPRINHHSHNDVGHFSVYLNGTPMIIDLGQGAYSKSTFSEERDDMWHISSEGHNVPKINGLLQRPGTGSEARDVQFSNEGGVSSLNFDAAPSYFENSTSSKVLLQISFEHDAANIHIEDRIELAEALSDFQLPDHVCGDCTVTADHKGEITLSTKAGAQTIATKNLVLNNVESVVIDDPRHQEVWGTEIKRIWLKAEKLAEGCFSLSICRH